MIYRIARLDLSIRQIWKCRTRLALQLLDRVPGTGSFSFGARSLAGIGTTTDLSYVNSIGRGLMGNGRFNIGEDLRGTSFAKTFDVVG